jgi:diguanylate cyclase (GGDEF)-like protein
MDEQCRLEAWLSLRSKIYLIVGATLLVAVAVVFMVSQTVFMRGFASVESTQAQDQIKRAQAAVTWDVLELGIAVKSYGTQGEILTFLRTKDSTYTDSSLSASFFTGVRANAAAILDQDGSILWGRGFDLDKYQFTPLPSALQADLSPQGSLSQRFLAGTEVSGILMVSGVPMLIDSQPIVDPNSGGTAKGTFIIGRWVDTAVLAELGARTRLDLSLLAPGATDLPAQVRDAAATAGTTATTFVIPRDTKTVAGYAVLQDVFGQPALVMQVEMPRAVWAQGASSVRYFMLSLFALVVVFGLVLNQLLERSLFRRLAGITAQVHHMRPGRAKLEPITAGGNDELGLLAETINTGFLQLEVSRAQQEVQAQNLSSTLQELNGRHQDLTKSHVRLQQLQHVSASLGSSLDIKDALVQLETVALDIFEADEIWLLKLRPNQDQLVGLGAFFRSKPGYARLPRLFGCERPEAALPEQVNGLLRTVFHGSDAIFIGAAGAMTEEEQRGLFGAVLPDLAGFESLALVPLIADDAALGLAISASSSPGEFSADRRSTILLFAGQLAQALKNTRLVEEIKALGETDPLSGLFNRRRALEQLEMDLKRAQRYEGRFSVMIADIDNFKLFNDTYGHPLGDEIIKRVAALLLRRARTSDFVARFGGDEFLLILPEAYRADAKKVADSMRAALATSPYIAPDGARIPLRMSFGASSFPEDGHDAAALIAVADANLYESKRWGGDTVTVRPEPISGEAVDSRAFSTLDSLVSAVDNKDHYTRRHSAQVAEYTTVIGKALGLNDEQQEALRVASLLHDVGKIGVPDRILRKPGTLTTKEAEYMRQHPLIGSMMIMQHLPESMVVKDAVAAHHERWDGGGYPAQLLGRQIPLLARILAVADAFSAMITDRPYHAALDSREALDKLVEGSGTQFDPDMVRMFVAAMTPTTATTAGAA